MSDRQAIERALEAARADDLGGSHACDAWKRAYATDVQALLKELDWLQYKLDQLQKSWNVEHEKADRWRFWGSHNDLPG